jgi:hypothetical protein
MHFGFDSPYDIQIFLIYTLIILSLTFYGCLHSIKLTAAYSINCNGNFTFDLGLFDWPLFPPIVPSVAAGGATAGCGRERYLAARVGTIRNMGMIK